MLTIARLTCLLAVIFVFEECQTAPLGENEGETARIVNGTEALPGQFPFAAFLKNLFYNGSYNYACTISLITSKTCLGAAHCVFQLDKPVQVPASKFCGVVGTVDRTQSENCHPFSEIRVHEHFVYGLTDNDIATLIFVEKVELDKTFVDTVPLIGGDGIIKETTVTAIGWGKLYHRGDSSEPKILRYVNLNLLPKEDCHVPDINLCLASEGKGICNGDSGGPNVITRLGKHIQIGISSFTSGGCAVKFSYLTAVQAFAEWIQVHSEGEPVFVSE